MAALRGEVEGLQTDLAAARDSIAAANSRIQEQQSELDSNAGRRLAAAGGGTQHHGGVDAKGHLLPVGVVVTAAGRVPHIAVF